MNPPMNPPMNTPMNWNSEFWKGARATCRHADASKRNIYAYQPYGTYLCLRGEFAYEVHKQTISALCDSKIIKGPHGAIVRDQYRRQAFEKRELYRRLFAALYVVNVVFKMPSGPFYPAKGTLKLLNRSVYVLNRRSKHYVRTGTYTRVRNRCIVSGMPSSIANLGLSRIQLRALGGAGLVPGLIKI